MPAGSSVVRPYAACFAGSVSSQETVARASGSSPVGQGMQISLLVPPAESLGAEASVAGRLFVPAGAIALSPRISVSPCESHEPVGVVAVPATTATLFRQLTAELLLAGHDPADFLSCSFEYLDKCSACACDHQKLRKADVRLSCSQPKPCPSVPARRCSARGDRPAVLAAQLFFVGFSGSPEPQMLRQTVKLFILTRAGVPTAVPGAKRSQS